MIYNPARLDTDQPTIRVRRLTDLQVAEVAYRLDTTAETDDLTDWGWLDGRTLHIIKTPAAIQDAITDRNSDLRTCLDIAQSNVDSDSDPQALGMLFSMRSLVKKVEAAVAAQGETQ